jgi:glycyl-tRNA synthetase beta chain
MKAEFLLEIGTEEIPAWMIPGARASLRELLEKELAARGLLVGKPVETSATPRRLVAWCEALSAAEPDRIEEVTGPPRAVAFAPDGKPTRAAESFAQKQGVKVGELITVDTPKGSYVAAVRREKGKPAREVLAKALPGLITRIAFPRTMYWTSARALHFIRPIRWIVALLCGEVVKFELEGVRSGRMTRGHRILAEKNIAVRGVRDYRQRLSKARVALDPEERRRRIREAARRALQPQRLRWREDAGLLETLVYSVEHPAVVGGEFAREFLSLPEEVLVTVMQHQQKYFSVEDAKGQLAPRFLAVIDLDGDAAGEIRRGHETVLAARFRDAQFFWQADQKCPLAERLPLLARVALHEKLGSYAQKASRLAGLAGELASRCSSADGRRADIQTLRRAAQLAKVDLTTEMVREFPELQGIVGGLYARAQGEPEVVARAIYEHYRPVGPEDRIPETLEGSILALADKLDAIVACLAAGLLPSGSSDPFALRRAAGGIVRIIIERGLRASVSGAVAQAILVLAGQGLAGRDDAKLRTDVLTFVEERARYLFRDVRGHPYDEVNAVFAAGWDDLVDAGARLAALRRLRPTPDFEPLAAAFKRIRNILEQAGDPLGREHAARAIDSNYIEAGPERELLDRFHALRARVEGHRAKHQYEDALRLVAALRPHVDRFFDKVLVMAPDTALRQNRLTLLAHLLREFSTVADFSEIVTGPRPKE